MNNSSDNLTNDEQLHARATTYVFGELSAEENVAFEAKLSQSATLRSLVTSIRETVDALETEFANEVIPLSDSNRQQVATAIAANQSPNIQAANETKVDVSQPARRIRWMTVLVIAASVLLAVGLIWPKANHLATQVMTSTIEQHKTPPNSSPPNELSLEVYDQVLAETGQPVAAAADITAGTSPEAQVEFVPELGQVILRGKKQDVERVEAMIADKERTTRFYDRSGAGAKREASSAAKPFFKDSGTDTLDASIAGPPYAARISSAEKSKSLSKNLNSAKTIPAPSSTQRSKPQQIARGTILANSGSGGMGGGGSSERRGVAGPASGGTAAPRFELNASPGKIRRLNSQRISGRASESKDFGMEMEMGMDMGMDMLMSDDFSIAADAPMAPANATVANREHLLRRRSNLDAKAKLNLPGFTEESLVQDRFAAINDTPFRSVASAPLSTFSIDVDTAAYSKVRMYLMQHQQLPSPDAVRIEELVNYFKYNYAEPTGAHPFAAAMEIASCPWNANHRLARVGIKGKSIDDKRPPSNLVFLLDVSGSMNQPNKLPLVLQGMKMLVSRLGENDSVAIVVYAGAAGLVLDSTTGDHTKTIIDSLEQLHAGGSTAGAQGIQLAYQVARDHFIPGGTNRVILCTDGDFNVGVTGTDALVKLAAENAKGNIFLTMLGFGSGNHNDAMMEEVSNKTNGNYAFIDTQAEAAKVLVDQMQGTLVTIAKDVKVQIEFNPTQVASYRLIGYENRILAADDFANDKKDAGEIGAGHTVTALYELVPVGDDKTDSNGDQATHPKGLRYQKKLAPTEQAHSGELLILKLRYKQPTGTKSTLLEFPVKDSGKGFDEADQDFQFASSVAAFGMLLRNSPHSGDANFDSVEELATAGAKNDQTGYRTEFVELVRQAKRLAK
ncbi:YfbK domain-containing protein [Stieleria marina]|uniref:von Willebrand factor n=1 Tax=Stieleria marina TaxID=1930275 RepID=A0A517NX07_9BACT|nr:von Willebrand factor [Planctomycetes bacterium K23_9]